MTRHLIGAFKRIWLSLLSAGVAVCFSAILFTFFGSMRRHDFRGLGAVWLYGVVVLVGFGYRAWIVAIPAVIFLTNLRGWRFWALLVLGTSIGPFTFYLETIFWGGGTDVIDPLGSLISAIVSFTASLIYLFLLRRSQSGARSPERVQRLFDSP